MYDIPIPVLALGQDTATATHANAAIVYSAQQGNIAHVLSGLVWSYGSAGTLAGGRITVADGSTIVFDIDVTVNGPGFFPFSPPKIGSPGQSMTVTIYDGGASVAGKINATDHWTQPYAGADSGSTAGGGFWGLDFSQQQNSMYI